MNFSKYSYTKKVYQSKGCFKSIVFMFLMGNILGNG